jgi:hypothetical protein
MSATGVKGRDCAVSCYRKLVEPGGFEPPTFPVSPGRVQESLDEPAIFLPLDILLSSNRLTSRCVLFRVTQRPGSAIFQGFRIVRLVIGDPLFKVFSLANVVAACRFALEDVRDRKT